jgi:hypothetical protein
MFDFIFSVYARIIRSIMRATSAPAVAGFMLPPLRYRMIGRGADADFSSVILTGGFTVWGWSADGLVLILADGTQAWLDRSDTPESVWLGTVDWFMARQAH